MTRRRLDAELVRRGLAASRAEAQAAVRGGLVRVRGSIATKPSTMVDPADALEVVAPARRFVSRGGAKLEAALHRFGVDPSSRDCLDAGASTGGFTDCLLQRGAARVIAVDVGYGQLAWRLRHDPRVIVLERTNVRDLHPSDLPYAPTVLVADLSFISLTLVAPALAEVAAPDAEGILLVKPQFEVGRADVGRGGVVRDPGSWRRAVEGVAGACARWGLSPTGVMASPLPGPAGNVEFLLHVARSRGPASVDLGAAIEEGMALVGVSP